MHAGNLSETIRRRVQVEKTRYRYNRPGNITENCPRLIGPNPPFIGFCRISVSSIILLRRDSASRAGVHRFRGVCDEKKNTCTAGSVPCLMRLADLSTPLVGNSTLTCRVKECAHSQSTFELANLSSFAWVWLPGRNDAWVPRERSACD